MLRKLWWIPMPIITRSRAGLTKYALVCAVMAALVMPGAAEEGAYTAEQAERGQEVFRMQCAACHGDTLVTAFEKYSTALKFYHFISGAMPRHAPGSLTEQEYLDLVAYFLDRAEFPQGNSELTADRATLEEITIKDR